MGLRFIKIMVSILAVVCYVVVFGFICIMAPFVFGHTPVVIQSSSMEPSIKTGSIVYYSKVERFEELVIGDVVTFRVANDSPMVTHRIMAIDSGEKTIRTMGDNNDSMDIQILKFENVVGKVGEFYIPKVGFYIAYAQKPYVIAVIAAIIVLNVALSYVGNKKDEQTSEES